MAPMNIAGMIAKYFAISFAIENVVRDPRVIRSCLPISTTSRSHVLFSDNCHFEDVSFVDSYFENCSFNTESFKQVTFTGCKFNNCKIISEPEKDIFKQIHCYGCDDFNTGFIKKLSNIEDIIIPDETKESLSIQILGKYFKVDGKTPKMKYVSSIRRDFENENLDEVFEIFHSLKKQGYILIGGNNSYISKKGIAYYHKNNK